MVSHFDHVTVVVRDVEAAKRFSALLGFEHDRSVVISGEVFSSYMGVPGIEMPNHDPTNEPFPAWVDEWHEAFDAHADVTTYAGARLSSWRPPRPTPSATPFPVPAHGGCQDLGIV